MPAIYYVKESDILYRRSDGDDEQLPDEVLWSSGWRPLIGQLTVSSDARPKPIRRGTIDGGADPTLWTKISKIEEAEAREVAVGRGLPLIDW